MSLDKPPYDLVVTVLGAGTMGAQIAAHFANCGVKAHLLDLLPRDCPDSAPRAVRNSTALSAIKQLGKSRPPALMSSQFAARIIPGNLTDDLEKAVAASDLIIEAVVERLDVKQQLFGRVAAAARPDAVLATNTSGIPVGQIAQSLPEAARAQLVGLHFFNPPRYMHLLEIVPSSFNATRHEWLAQIQAFCESTLGKGVVICRDTPNFIGNRIGIAEMLFTFEAAKNGFTIEEVDFLNGPLMGRPKTGSFRLGDMVGLDIIGHVVENLGHNLVDDASSDNYDPMRARLQTPAMLKTLIERKALGDKTGGGFYRKQKAADGSSEILALDLQTMEYRPTQKARFDELRDIIKTPQLERKVAAALRVEGRVGDFLRNVYLPLFNYAATLVGHICDTPAQIDQAMQWGFGWKLGPFALWDAAGVAWAVQAMRDANIEPCKAALDLVAQQGESATWYKDGADAAEIFVAGKGYQAQPARPRTLALKQIKAARPEVAKNSSAALLDLGDGIACLEFRSKMNTLDEGVIEMIEQAPALAKQKGFIGLVVGNEGEDFSVGANLMQVMGWIMQKNFDAIEGAVGRFQQAMMGLRHGPIPVVTAPFGRTLGGGVELSLHGHGITAHAELYMGLVELGVGLLPAGGGLKEICRRAAAWAQQVPDGDAYPWVRRGFELTAGAKVSMSAHEGREHGWLQPGDGIVAHRSQLIYQAKQHALSLAAAGALSPDRNEAIAVIGRDRAASFVLGAQMFVWGGYASEHDQLIANKIAHVLAGGDTTWPTTVSAQHLLDLEREAFVSLCGEPKTLARIGHMLEKGKPLRN